MNAKTAKLLRKVTGFNPKAERIYKSLETQDINGKPREVETTKVSTGKRKDYQILKKYFKGEDVILPNHLKEAVE